LEKRLKIGPSVPPEIKIRIIALVKKLWCCFFEENVKTPITGYQCVIDTGSAIPTVAKNIRYGIHETPIMQSAIDALLANGSASTLIALGYQKPSLLHNLIKST
jgi:hypothetical protein